MNKVKQNQTLDRLLSIKKNPQKRVLVKLVSQHQMCDSGPVSDQRLYINIDDITRSTVISTYDLGQSTPINRSHVLAYNKRYTCTINDMRYE